MIQNYTPGCLKIKDSTLWNLSESYFDWGGKIYKVEKIDNRTATLLERKSKATFLSTALKMLTLPLIGLFALGIRTYFRRTYCVSYQVQSSSLQQIPNPLISNGSISLPPSKRNTSNCIKGTMSQFSEKFDQMGASACTPMSIKAAEMLLEKNDWSDITEKDLDGLIPKGIELYRKIHPTGNDQYTNSEQAFGKLVQTNLTTDNQLNKAIIMHPFDAPSRLITCRGNFDYLIRKVFDNINLTKTPCALILTSRGITITLIIKGPKEFWIYDSHGKQGDNPVLAYIERCNSYESVLDALDEKFYYVDPYDDAKVKKGVTFENLPQINPQDLDGIQAMNRLGILALTKK